MRYLVTIIFTTLIISSCKSYHDKEIKEQLTIGLKKDDRFRDFRIEIKNDIVSVFGETYESDIKSDITNIIRNFKNVKSVNDYITLKSKCDKWIGTFYGKDDSDPFMGTSAIKLEIQQNGSIYKLIVRRKEGLMIEVTPVIYTASCNGENLYCKAQNSGDKVPGFDIEITDYTVSFNKRPYTRESYLDYFN